MYFYVVGKNTLFLFQAMKHLHDKVNIIPVIGKSDACTQDEIKQFKATVCFKF
jgi:septin family protein